LAAELAEAGTRLTAATCDVADRSQVIALLDGLAADGHEVRTVIHAAAHIELGSLAATTVADFARVVAAKAAGARHLSELVPADTFVLFSSIAGVWGSGDHAAYAAANAYLDALAEQLRAAGRSATSLAWGVWAAVNPWDTDRAIDGIDNGQLRRRGLPLMAPDRAFAAMANALDRDETTLTVADVDWANFLPVFGSARSRPLFRDLAEARSTADGPTGPGLREQLLARDVADRERMLLDLVRTHAAAVLGHPGPEAIDPTRPFKEIGFDSLTAVELRTRLGGATGLRLPATLVFDHPTATELAGFVAAELAPVPAEPDEVLDELARLEQLLATRRPDQRITARLRSLLWRCADGGDADLDDDDIGAATDDEIFALIDHDLGSA
jgi:short-subunit dehydrogenase/acyl carrier protein